MATSESDDVALASALDDDVPREQERARHHPVPTRAALAVALLAGVVGYLGAWRVSLWSDEVATISAAECDPSDLARLLGNIDAVHGLYYGAMHVWITLFGASPASIRSSSALAVAAAAAGVVVLGSRLADARTGIVAGVAFALLPRVTWSAVEARSWAATLALAVWATVALHAATEGRRRRWWVLYGGLGALAVATNIYVAMLWAAHGLTVVIAARSRERAWVITTAAAALAAGGVVLVAAGQGGQLGSAELTPTRLARTIVVNQWFLGETPTPTTGSGLGLDGWADAWKIAAVALALAAWGVVTVGIVRGLRSRARLLAWSLPWLIVPTVLVVAAAVVRPSLYNPRYLAFCAPALALLIGYGLRTLGRTAAVATGVALVLLAVPVYVSQRGVLSKSSSDLALAADQLRARARPGDAIYYGPRDPAVDGLVYRSLRTIGIGYPDAVVGLTDIALVQSPAAGANLFGTSRDLAASLDGVPEHGTLWVARREDRPAESEADDATLSDAGFAEVSTWHGPQTEIVELRR